MVSRCANPECGEPFVYLRNGHLFTLPRNHSASSRATVEFFWLCERCAEVLRPEFGQGAHGLALVARHEYHSHP